MCVLALLAVFTANAVDGSGPAFAIVYSTFLADGCDTLAMLTRQVARPATSLLCSTVAASAQRQAYGRQIVASSRRSIAAGSRAARCRTRTRGCAAARIG